MNSSSHLDILLGLIVDIKRPVESERALYDLDIAKRRILVIVEHIELEQRIETVRDLYESEDIRKRLVYVQSVVGQLIDELVQDVHEGFGAELLYDAVAVQT